MCKKGILMGAVLVGFVLVSDISNASVSKIVCHEVNPTNVHSRVSRVLSKVGVKNQKVLGYVDKIFQHDTAKQVSAKMDVYCKK